MTPFPPKNLILELCCLLYKVVVILHYPKKVYEYSINGTYILPFHPSFNQFWKFEVFWGKSKAKVIKEEIITL